MIAFAFNQLIKFLVLYAVSYGTGLLVQRAGLRVNYSRKVNHFMIFFAPLWIDRIVLYDQTMFLVFLSALLTICIFFTFAAPLRRRVAFLRTAFASWDRPEDRPHTFVWLITQAIAGYAIIVPAILLFDRLDLLALVFIPILINGIGDGLAEPVGVRFGRHRYSVRALFTDKRYVRSFEGSACVFITTLLVVLLHAQHLQPLQLALGLLLLPPIMTLTEAFSPHTWDTPTIFLVGYMSVLGITFF